MPLGAAKNFLIDKVSINIPEPILGQGHRAKRARKVFTGEGKWEDWGDY